MSQVDLQKIVKRYGELEVVHGIDLLVNSKEFVVLVGSSSCGKSTTLRMIAGLEEISGGEISIGNRIANDVAPKDRDVAMVFQKYALYPHLNVAETFAFDLRIRRVPKDEIKRAVSEVAEILGLTEYLKRKPSDLSGGQRQRVTMGRAIVRHPEVFYLMNHYLIWMLSYAPRCGPRLNSCIRGLASFISSMIRGTTAIYTLQERTSTPYKVTVQKLAKVG